MPGNGKQYDASCPIIELRYEDNDAMQLIFEKLSLDLPQTGERLIHDFTMALSEGERLAITGPSGSGKSTVVRAMRGLWKTGAGTITIPKNAQMICLSQQIEFPRTSLRGILTSPKLEREFDEKDIDEALRDVQLKKLRIHLPLNQAQASYLSSLSEKYLARAFGHWQRSLRTLAQRQKDAFCDHVKVYIENYASNFFDQRWASHLSTGTRKDLGEAISLRLARTLDAQLPVTGRLACCFPVFRLKRLGRNISRYILQGVARDLRRSQMTGIDFSRQLSGGEQQRLMFARILLHKPEIIIMDEATSALDEKSAEAMYALITNRLPRAIIISITHASHLARYHTHHGQVENRRIRIRRIPQPVTVSAAGMRCIA